MTHSSSLLKNKLGFVSLLVLASCLACPGADAMDPPQPEKRTIPRQTRNQQINDLDPASFLNYFKALRKRADDNDWDAQDELVESALIFFGSTSEGQIPDTFHDFYKWEGIEERCCTDLRYASMHLGYRSDIKEYYFPHLKFPHLFEKLKEQAKTSPEAKVNLAHMYMRGNGVKKNEEFAHTLYKQAADAGCASAQCILSDIYESQNEEELSMFYLQKAIEQGVAEAQNRLGDKHYYLNGKKALAFEAYEKAAKQGNSFAEQMLATYYQDAQDPTNAVIWMAKCRAKRAAYGVDIDQSYLSLHCLNGLGVRKDPLLALSLYLTAKAESGKVQRLLRKDPEARKSFSSLITFRETFVEVDHNLVNNTFVKIETSSLRPLIAKYDMLKLANHPDKKPHHLPSLYKKYGKIADNIGQLLEAVVGFSKKYKEEGFMILPRSISQEIQNAKHPYLTTYNVGNKPYLCCGEENVAFGGQLLACLDPTGNPIITQLKKTEELYEGLSKQVKKKLVNLMDMQLNLNLLEKDTARKEDYTRMLAEYSQKRKDYKFFKGSLKEVHTGIKQDIKTIKDALKQTKDMIHYTEPARTKQAASFLL